MTKKSDYAWAAGILSSSGSIQAIPSTDKAKGFVRLTLHSSTHAEALLKFADIFELGVTELTANKKPAWKVQMTSKPLHAIMLAVWPWLTDARKREYKRALQSVK